MGSKLGARRGAGMEGRKEGGGCPLRDWFISLDTRFLCFGFYDYSFSFFARERRDTSGCDRAANYLLALSICRLGIYYFIYSFSFARS